jgi:hypothetical protein
VAVILAARYRLALECATHAARVKLRRMFTKAHLPISPALCPYVFRPPPFFVALFPRRVLRSFPSLALRATPALSRQPLRRAKGNYYRTKGRLNIFKRPPRRLFRLIRRIFTAFIIKNNEMYLEAVKLLNFPYFSIIIDTNSLLSSSLRREKLFNLTLPETSLARSPPNYINAFHALIIQRVP